MEGRIFSSPIVLGEQVKRNMPQKYHHYTLLAKVPDQELQNDTVVFSLEEALLKSSSLFPYFMLVAFEGVGLLRSLILLLLYPFLLLLGPETSLKAMVFICFLGVERDSFLIGKSVLPKFFLENVGLEGFEVVKRFGTKVAYTNLPRVMVETFLTDYLGVSNIVGGEIKVAGGYYLGLMDNCDHGDKVKDIFSGINSQVVGIGGTQKSFLASPFSFCKDIFMVSEDDKANWHQLPREKYSKPLIFHDGRLAFNPTPINSLVMFMWLPFGIMLVILRLSLGILLPYKVSTPILAFIGISYSSSNHASLEGKSNKGMVFVCNHRTVVDPIYISYICRVHLTALTYSVSNLTKFLAPIKTITLTRDREKDAEIMRDVLSKGNVVVCPEGTTCREPYLLRFSPLFAAISDDIIPLALQVSVSMFYATTASGIKALDPFFFMLNPWPYYHVSFLDKVPSDRTCGRGGASKFDVANYVQAEIGRALGYKCTHLTRKDKYLMLAGNSGLVR